MEKYKVSRSKAIFDIHNLQQQISDKEFNEVLFSICRKDTTTPGYVWTDAKENSIKKIMDIRAALSKFITSSVTKNKQVVEKVLCSYTVRWIADNEFSFNYYGKMTNFHGELIELRTNHVLNEHSYDNDIGSNMFYYSLQHKVKI
jgi:hypothetical protein